MFWTKKYILASLFMCAIVLLSVYFLENYGANDKIHFFDSQRKGANYFNKKPCKKWFIAAKQKGIQIVRLAPDKWRGEYKDFLLGDADSFKKIPLSDFRILKEALDEAHASDIKVVITMLSLPGSRWRQNNQGKDDLRIWKNVEYQEQAICFWQQLACLLKEHPAVVGYNIINEPHPECIHGFSDYRKIDFYKWYTSVKGTCADLNLFYRNVVKAIREVDSKTPIILDAGLFATPWAIEYLDPIDEKGVVYSFHMYEPYVYTTKKLNKKKYQYPGTVPVLIDDENSDTICWNTSYLKQFLLPVFLWQKKHNIPSSRIFVGEFGCDRTSKGVEVYLNDLIQIFNEQKWHWAFYSFREDCWDSMDYELGIAAAGWKYWEFSERGDDLDCFRHDNPLFDVIKKELM